MFLALAELRRSLGRFALLGSAVGLLVLLLLFFQAVAGALTGGLTGAFDAAEADVWVYDDAARRNPQASVLDDGIVDQVLAVAGVEGAGPVTFTVFDVAGSPAAIVALDPDSPALPRELDSGRRAESATEVVVGTSSFAGGELGDQVTLGSTDLAVVGSADGATFNVLPTIFAGREVVAEAVSERVGAPVPLPVSAVAVTASEGTDPAELAVAITESVAGVEAVDAATAIASLPGAGQITRSFSILYVLLYLVVGIVTAVFFLILTAQKQESMVLLRAIGARPNDLVRPIILQVLVIIGIAVVVGTGVAVGLLSLLQDTFGAQVQAGTVATSSGAILVLGLVAGILSVRRVLAIDPVDAVRGGGIA